MKVFVLLLTRYIGGEISNKIKLASLEAGKRG